MTDTNEAAFWTSAQPAPDRGWMAKGRANVARWNAAQAPAEPDVTAAEPTDYLMGMSMDEYAAQRSSMPVANDFGLVKENRSGFPDADLRLNAEQLAATGFGQRRFSNNGYTRRESGIDASLVESLDGHRGRGTINPNT